LTLSAIDVRIMPGAEKGDLDLFAFAVFMLSICCTAKFLVFAGSEQIGGRILMKSLIVRRYVNV